MMQPARSDLLGPARNGVLLVTALLVVVPCLAAAAPRIAADREAPVILVPPVRPVKGTESLRLLARVQDTSGVAAVTLWARGEQGDSYRPFPMTAAGDDEFVAELPSWPGRGNSVAYYVEATDRLGNGPRRSGDPRSPYIARVERLHPSVGQLPAVGPGKALLGGVLMALALVAFLVLRARSQQPGPAIYYEAGGPTRNGVSPEPEARHQETGAVLPPETEIQGVEEDLFWFRLLSPLLHLSPDEASLEIDRMADFQLRNPVNGMHIGGRGPLMQRLEWARGVDPKELRARRKRLLGAPRPGSSPRALPTAADPRSAAPQGSPASAAVDPGAADPSPIT